MKKRIFLRHNKNLGWHILIFNVTKHKTFTCIFKPYYPFQKGNDILLNFDFNYRPKDFDHTGFSIIVDLIFFGLDIEFSDRRHVDDYERIKSKQFEDNFIFDYATVFYDNKALAKHGDNWYEIDNNFHINKINQKFDNIYGDEAEDYLRIEQNNKQGIVDGDYNGIIETINDGEMFIVIKNGKYGIVDRKNKVVIDFLYDYITKTGDCYLVKQNGKFGYFHEYFGSVIINLNSNTHHQGYLG